MVNKQHAQFSDENGNIFYLENETEDVLDPSGKPLSNGGDLSEASVTFTPDATRKLPQSGGRFKAFLGSIVKFLSDLTEVAFSGNYSDLEGKPTIPPLANNCTTTAAGYGLDARQGKVLMDKANQLSSEFMNLSIKFAENAGQLITLPFVVPQTGFVQFRIAASAHTNTIFYISSEKYGSHYAGSYIYNSNSGGGSGDLINWFLAEKGDTLTVQSKSGNEPTIKFFPLTLA